MHRGPLIFYFQSQKVAPPYALALGPIAGPFLCAISSAFQRSIAASFRIPYRAPVRFSQLAIRQSSFRFLPPDARPILRLSSRSTPHHERGSSPQLFVALLVLI